MISDQPPDRRIVIALKSTADPLLIMHPCRCDAPDPESTRLEPLEVPRDKIQTEGRVLVVCPECDSHVLVIAAGRERES
jgi:hypothetical protein